VDTLDKGSGEERHLHKRVPGHGIQRNKQSVGGGKKRQFQKGIVKMTAKTQGSQLDLHLDKTKKDTSNKEK